MRCEARSLGVLFSVLYVEFLPPVVRWRLTPPKEAARSPDPLRTARPGHRISGDCPTALRVSSPTRPHAALPAALSGDAVPRTVRMPMLTRAGRRRRRAGTTPATHHQHVLELSPVTVAVVRTMSLRGLCCIRGVSRAFRDAATQRLQTLGRPVVGGGLPCDESCHTLETLNLATMEWELTPALPGCRCDAACADLREEGGGWRLVLAGGDTLAESDSAELRGWSVTKVRPKLCLPAAVDAGP